MAEAARLELEAAMAKAAENAVDDAARSWIRDVCIRAAAEDRRCPGALPELLKSLAAVFVAVTTQRQCSRPSASTLRPARSRGECSAGRKSLPPVQAFGLVEFFTGSMLPTARKPHRYPADALR